MNNDELLAAYRDFLSQCVRLDELFDELEENVASVKSGAISRSQARLSLRYSEARVKAAKVALQYRQSVGWRSQSPTSDWAATARKVAEFIEPIPLVELTAQEVKEFRWKFLPGRPHCIDGLDILLSFLRWLNSDRRTAQKPVIDRAYGGFR